MRREYLLHSVAARSLYEGVASLPIVDYHCHLSPKEIYEDKEFDNIGEMWLAYDHYKWRLMRFMGIDESYITGDKSWEEKFTMYISALEFAANHPLYHWSGMELSKYFEIEMPLTKENAAAIWQQANAYIKEHHLSPRKLITNSNVEIICTTDDLADDLAYHQLLKKDKSFATKVLPSYRYDNLLLMRREGYADYIAKLSEAAGVAITDLASLKQAMKNRLEYFVLAGCRITDVGIPYFPNAIAKDADADTTFCAALKGESIADDAYLALLGNLYLYLGGLFHQYGLMSQWHLAVTRNANSRLFALRGADCGCDCIGDTVSGGDLAMMLDAMDQADALPLTVVYSLNAANMEQLGCICGAFRKVSLGAAWWFNDHKQGIEKQLEILSQYGVLGEFWGMLTDSRSFLSYARHDYFRRILCDVVGKWVQDGEYPMASAVKLVRKVCYQNIRFWL